MAELGEVRFTSGAPVTTKRPPFIPRGLRADPKAFWNPGTARATIAASQEAPEGTTQDRWAITHRDMTVLQQHCQFFDPDHDGVIWPHDTFLGFHRLGFNIFLCMLAVFIIHANFSYPTCTSIFPDPFFRVYIARIHKDKHGSDTGTYDNEGRFIPQRFEDFISKYGKGKPGLSAWDVWDGLRGQRVLMDPIGWFATFLEWLATYILLWPRDGVMKKDDIRRVYDGSIFYELAAQREQRK